MAADHRLKNHNKSQSGCRLSGIVVRTSHFSFPYLGLIPFNLSGFKRPAWHTDLKDRIFKTEKLGSIIQGL